jgi:hypothetical protein
LKRVKKMEILTALSGVNPLAVIVAGIVHMVVGLLWYRPKIFGNAWTKLTGKDLNPAKQWLPLGVIGHLAIALVLAILINLAGVTDAVGGLAIAFLVWIGFIVTLEIGELIWEKIETKLFLIRIGEHLLSLSLAGIILAVW